MSRHNRTKDENYVICLYEQAEKSGDLDTPFDRYEIGKIANLHERGVDAICKLLIQANFVKKAEEHEVYLTQNGVNLAKQLLLE
jgi:hypothetical protein